jgi:hypothetical protein
MVRRWIGHLVLLLFCVPSARAADAQWIVVTAPAFREAMQPLCHHRKSQGLHVSIVNTSEFLDAKQVREGDAAKLRDHIHKLCRDFKGQSYILLVGAVEARQLDEPEKKVAPALLGTISRMKGQPSDNAYGCLDAGLMPSRAVGRLPARSVAEAEGMVKKILAYERDEQPGEWRRRLTVLAGIPAYNPFVDKLVESQAMARFDKLDPVWTGQAIYHNPQSRFCVPDEQLHDRALQLVQKGQAFTLYLGHSNATGFWGGEARFLDRDDWSKLKIRRGAGVFATFGCNGCQLSGRDGEGYGIAAIRNPNGPVAVMGSHGICFAAMVQLAADGLFRAGFASQPPERLGEMWLALKEGLAKGNLDAVTYNLLDAVDGDKKIPQAVQRQEHLEMFVLLGDPALRLATLPTDVKLIIEGEIAAGKTINIRGALPERLAGANVRLTLERPTSSEPERLEALPKAPADKRDRAMLANHERANRFAVCTKKVEALDRRFEARLELPEEVPWPRLIVRAYAANERHEGLGVRVLKVAEE